MAQIYQLNGQSVYDFNGQTINAKTGQPISGTQAAPTAVAQAPSSIAFGATNTNPTSSAGTITRTSSAPQPASTAIPMSGGYVPTPATPPAQPAPNLSTAPINTPNAVVQSTGGVPTGQVGLQPLLSPSAPSFGGLVGSLAGTSAAGSPATPIAIGGLFSTASNQSNYQQALGAYQNAYKTYQDLQSKIATQFGNLETSDQALPVVLGTEGALQRQYAAQLDAAQGAVSSASNALNAAISEQGTTQTGLNEAGTLGTTAQGLVQGGLQQAAALAQPSGTFPFVFNPITGQFTTGGTSGGATGNIGLTGNYQQDISSAASAIIKNPTLYNSYTSALNGYYGSTAPANLNVAITQLGGNPTTIAAQSSGAASTIQSIPAMQSADTAAQGINKQITQFLNSTPGLNIGGNVALANSVQQWLQGKQLTDPNYQTLFNSLSEYTNTLAPILGVGGDPTNLKTEIAQSFINPQASPSSIIQTLNNIQALADAKIQNLQSGATGGGVVSSTPLQNTQSASSGGTGTISTPYGTINPNL